MLDISDLADGRRTSSPQAEEKAVPSQRLAMNCDVLHFDQATAALDPRSQRWLLDLIVE